MAVMSEKRIIRPKAELRKEARMLPGYILLIAWTIFTFVILGWILFASLSTTPEIFSGDVGRFPSGLHFENYAKAWKSQNVSLIFGNSLVYTLTSCALLIVISAPAAYVLSRFPFFANKSIQKSLVTAMAVPVAMIVLPLYCLVARYGLVDNGIANRIVLIFLYVGTSVPYTVTFLISFFQNISTSYEEAAAIDGCTPVETFWRVIFPLAQPGIITVTLFNFNKIWGEYFISLIFANSDKMRPVAVGLFSMINAMRYTGDWAGLFAAVVIVVLPTLVLYLLLSEKLIAGVTVGGVKG